MGAEFQFGMMKRFWKWMVVMAQKTVNVLNATETDS